MATTTALTRKRSLRSTWRRIATIGRRSCSVCWYSDGQEGQAIMNRTIGLWILLGITVACCWVAAASFLPDANLGRSTIAAITAPAAYVGRTMPLSTVAFVLLNGFLYGVIGVLIVSLQRMAAHGAH